MKLFHISDLHFGKILHDISLVDRDQRFWVDSFLTAVDEEHPDAILIAGDVYDRRDPSTSALKLFDDMITALAKREVPVFVTPGNHDSAVRLAHMSPILALNQIHIASDLTGSLLPQYTLAGDCKVQITLMPYIFPKMVEDTRVLNRQDLDTYDDAVRALLKEQSTDPDAVNILVAHQNVLAHGKQTEHSASETMIGTLGEVDYSAFDAYDYVALGHIHNEQSVGRETIRYCGCPMYYDFSELGRKKGITVVEFTSKEDISTRLLEIPIMHGLLKYTGTVDELVAIGRSLTEKDKSDHYIMVTICQKNIPNGSVERLRAAFGDNLIHSEREREKGITEEESRVLRKDLEDLSIDQQFDRFYMEQQNEFLTDNQLQIIQKILEQQETSGYECVPKGGNVPEKDTMELLNLLEQLTEEAE